MRVGNDTKHVELRETVGKKKLYNTVLVAQGEDKGDPNRAGLVKTAQGSENGKMGRGGWQITQDNKNCK